MYKTTHTIKIQHRYGHLRGVAAVLLLMLLPVCASAQTNITSLSTITSDPTGNYRITADIDASGFTSIASFSGTLEAAIDPATHMPYRITNLATPLFDTLTGTVKNLVIENVSIVGNTGNTGAVACEASGSARIYNVGILGGTVGGTAYTGGLVGFLDGTARVVNCYSYANITGGSEKAGIVGYNNFASKYNSLKTMVMNCMFYGDIATGGTIAPIYGGLEISNDYNNNNGNRLNNYNYFLYETPFSEGRHISKYNCALAAEKRFLVRFEFYRHLVNSTREVACWYVTGSTANAHSTMMKWVLDRSVAPYPVLKEQGKYPSVVNYDPLYTNDRETGAKVLRTDVTEVNQGKNLGTLAVTISESNTTAGGQTKPASAAVTTTSLTLRRTDKDTANFNFNYDKVQLPYYNDVGSKNYTDNRVVTGWKITGFTNGTQGTYSTSTYDSPSFNFADRDTYAKDLYSISGRVFPQGGYFNVPKGVTGITIEPYWAACTYLSDANYDRYGYNQTDNLSLFGARYTNNTAYSINGSSQKVYTSSTAARDALPDISGATVYDYAVVLVGNYHLGDGNNFSETERPLTLMSIDLNHDNEPDYCFILKMAKNHFGSPLRYDFVTIPAMSMAHKMASSTDLAIPANFKPRGWFEVTTTGLIRFGQYEYSYDGKTLSPLILLGGVFEQFVSNNSGNGEKFTNKVNYMILGDNVWFKLFNNGTHADKTSPTPHRPISVVGGEYKKFYLTGYFRPDATPMNDNAECYIDGGLFDEVAGAGQERINGNVDWFINHADITNFYGGGINDAKPLQGNITTNIRNSRVTLFCGGPKFGNMNTDKTLRTTATNCTFGTYFGAGNGGNSIYLHRIKNEYQALNYNWTSDWIANSYDKSNNENYRGKFKTDQGIATGYEYEFFAGSAGNVARLYIHKVSFSLAQTNNVWSTLTNCTVLKNFYGGGNLGKVAGNVVSQLDSCIVRGSVYGAGYSATIPDVEVLDLGGLDPVPNYNQTTGVYEQGEYPGKKIYKWKNVASISDGEQCLETDSIRTSQDLTTLGTVTGNVSLTIKGTSKIGTLDGEGNLVEGTGNVFGGGEESAVSGESAVTVTVTLQGKTEVYGDVFGGGNKGRVDGSTSVTIED